MRKHPKPATAPDRGDTINDPTQLLKDIANSRTTTKVLSILTIGIAAASLLKSGNTLIIAMTAAILALLALTIFISIYYDAKKKEKGQTPNKPATGRQRRVFIDNAILLFLFLMFISILT